MSASRQPIDTPEEIAEVRAFFRSLPPSEQVRLLRWFAGQFAVELLPEKDWRDYTADGHLQANPPGLAKVAGVGK